TLVQEDVRPKLDPRAHGYALSPAQLVRLREGLRQLAEGLTALHGAGKLHRDIKPSNVMVAKNGRVVVLDFGLVTEMYEEWLIKSTLEGVVCGTVAYMAPEQGAGLVPTPASDWYAVGVMLYEALTGRLPFEGRLFDILLDKQRLDPASPRTLVPSVPDDLDRLCVELLRRRPEERPTGREVLQRLTAPGSDVLTPMHAWTVPIVLPQFVGRERQLAMLEDAFRTAEKGSPVIVHVHGRSGIGKSSLVKHFLDELSAGERVVVLAGRCYEREIVPYKAFDSVIDALSRYLRKLPDSEVDELVGPDIRALARIFPVLSRVEAIGAAPQKSLGIPDPLELRRRAFAALRTLLGNIAATRRLVIYIDDLQWGDEDSAALLADLLRPPHPPPLFFVTCYRSEDRETSPFVRALRGAAGTGFAGIDTREVHVGPLELEDATRLARSILAEREQARVAEHRGWTPARALVHAEAIARESAGNPLFVYELASFADAASQVVTPREGTPMRPDAFLDQGSASSDIKLERALRARFAALPPGARRLLEIVVVAARPIELALANRAAGLAPDDRTAAGALKSARLVRQRTAGHVEQLETYHNRIGDAAVKDKTPDELRDVHLAIASVLERAADPDPEALVLHLAAAGEQRRAGEHAAAAAERAKEALAFDRAATLYQLCVQLAPPSDADEWRLRQRLGEALVNAGRGHEAAEVYLVAARTAPKGDALELRRRAAQQLLQTGHVDRGTETFKGVVAEVGLPWPESAQSAVRLLNVDRVKLTVRGLKFKEKRPDERSAEDLTAIDVCWSAVTGFAMVHGIRAAYYHTRGLLLAFRSGEPYRLARALAAEVCLVGGVDRRRDRTARVLEALEGLARVLDEPHARGLVELATGFTAFLRGQWLDAIVHAERSLAIHTEQCTGVAWELDTARIVLFSSLAYRGELGDLPDRVFAELRQAELRKNLYASTILRTSPNVSKMWLALDRVDDARQELALAMERWSHADFHVQHLHALLSETDFDLYDGQGLRAWSRISRRWDQVWGSQLLRLRLFRIEARFGRARSALAAAAEGHDVDKLIKVAAADADDIEGMGMSWAAPIAELVRAELAVLKKNVVEAEHLFARAAQGFDAAGMGLHRAVASFRRGQLLGGDEGRALVDASERWMRARGVRIPAKVVATFAPVGR
ncbi:AAA family ATPase, partial [Myxococcota bacterium]|nr:AAA family ATPase [Myxococcota bacterium]